MEKTGTLAIPERAVLEGVPRVGFEVRLCPFPGCLESCMRYLGEPVDYDQLMGVTGAAFRRIWNRDDGGNVDLMYLRPEPYQRAASLLGRTLTTVTESRDAMIAAIAIANGLRLHICDPRALHRNRRTHCRCRPPPRPLRD